MKLAIFMRKDLDMRAGKMCAQAGHASVLAYDKSLKDVKRFSTIGIRWLNDGQKKIVLKVPDEQTLNNIESHAVRSHLAVCRVVDFGLTQISPNTLTCIAVGPDEDEKIDEITKGYLLL